MELLDYKTEENRKKLFVADTPVKYYNPFTNPFADTKKPIGDVSIEEALMFKVEVNGNTGLIVQRISFYDYIVNGTLVSQRVGASIELLEAFTKNCVTHDDWTAKFQAEKELRITQAN